MVNNIVLYQTTTCKMFYTLILTCLLSIVQSHVMPCLANDICDPDFLCCESFGKQWCCPGGQTCCSDEDGCCPVPLPEVNSSDNLRTKYYLDIATTSHKNHQSKSLHKCDKEGKFYCGKTETCCKVGKSWKCCPYTNGTCCGNLCCPSEMSCNSIINTNCETMEKYPKRILQEVVSSKEKSNQYILCPDDIRVCSDTNTCCLVANDTYGCCPYENAVCCSDFTHCCPPDTVCNIDLETCDPCDKNLPRKRFLSLAKVVSWLLVAGQRHTNKKPTVSLKFRKNN